MKLKREMEGGGLWGDDQNSLGTRRENFLCLSLKLEGMKKIGLVDSKGNLNFVKFPNLWS